jgi:hypothetical protein
MTSGLTTTTATSALSRETPAKDTPETHGTHVEKRVKWRSVRIGETLKRLRSTSVGRCWLVWVSGGRQQPAPRRHHFASALASPPLPPRAVTARRSSDSPPPRSFTSRDPGRSWVRALSCQPRRLPQRRQLASPLRSTIGATGSRVRHLVACAPTFTVVAAVSESSTPALSVNCANRG